MNPSTETSGITRKQIADDFDAIDQQVSDLNDHKRELLVSYRAQLTASGMGKDEIKSEVEAIKAAIKRRRAVAKEGALTVEEKDALVDEVFAEITSPAPRATRVATTVPDGFDPETGEEITEPQDAQAPAQAHPGIDPLGDATSLPGAEGAEDRDTITEPQSAPQAESDLTQPALGQVATLPEAKASEDGGATAQAIEGPADSVAGDASRASDGAGSVAPIQTETEAPYKPQPFSIGPLEPREAGGLKGFGFTVKFGEPAAPLYAAPGVVTMEHTPPEPVKWHPYANCFPTVLGEYLAELEAGIHTAFGGVQKPIVKIGNLILDGRARYGIARSLLIDYPVVQYDGTDPLMDVIAWNIASRGDRFTDKQRKATAEALCKLEPTRADEIMQAFGLEMAEAAE